MCLFYGLLQVTILVQIASEHVKNKYKAQSVRIRPNPGCYVGEIWRENSLLYLNFSWKLLTTCGGVVNKLTITV
jgi:hypothetical protein